jgi:predicted flap endonuclease-1-like 5' DNA nuclease
MAKSVIEIEGIGPVYAGKLKEAGINTVEAILEQGASKSGRKAMADKSGIDEKLILRWVNMADLFRLNGVGEQYSDLLEAAGVDTVKELKGRVPANLHAKMEEVNAAKNLVRSLPSLSAVEKWVEEAKTLEAVVTY